MILYERTFVQKAIMVENTPTQTILDAAQALFLSKGYNGTSMRDIAKAAGYRSVAGLYNHFPDKESILIALLDNRHPYDELLSRIEAIEATHFEDLIRQIVEIAPFMITKHADFIRLLMLDFLEFNAAHVRALLTRFQERMAQMIFIKVHQIEGVRDDLPPLLIMRFITMQLFGYVVTRTILPPAILDVMSEEAWQAHLIDVVLRGLSKEQKK